MSKLFEMLAAIELTPAQEEKLRQACNDYLAAVPMTERLDVEFPTVLPDGWWIPHPGTLKWTSCNCLDEAMDKWFEGFNIPRLVYGGKMEGLHAANGRVADYFARTQKITRDGADFWLGGIGYTVTQKIKDEDNMGSYKSKPVDREASWLRLRLCAAVEDAAEDGLQDVVISIQDMRELLHAYTLAAHCPKCNPLKVGHDPKSVQVAEDQ